MPASRLRVQAGKAYKAVDFTFVQISDGHLGFNKAANTDVNFVVQRHELAVLDTLLGG